MMKLLHSSRHWLIMLFVVNSLIMPFIASADTIYKWVDENGRTHFSQKPPESNSNTAKKINIKAQSASQLESNALAREKLKAIKEKWNKELKAKRKMEKSRYESLQSSKREARQEKKRRQKQDRKSKKIWDKRAIDQCKKRKGINCKTAVDARRDANPVSIDESDASAWSDERRYKQHNPYRGIDKKKRCAYGYLDDCEKK